MAFLALTSAQCDADSPVDETLMQLIRTNLDDHEARIGTNEAQSNDAILTDFAAVDRDGDDWIDYDNGVGYGVGAIITEPDHLFVIHCDNSAEYFFLAGSLKRMRVQLDTAHTVVIESRIKHQTAPDLELFLGLQDAGLTGDQYADLSDCIGFVKGGATTTVKVRMAKAGSATESGNVGDTTNWTKLKLVITKVSGGALTVAAELNDSAISGSPWNTNIPDTTVLRPVMGVSAFDNSNRRMWFDYFRAYWQARPLSEA